VITRLLQLVVAVLCMVGCTAAHYHKRQSDSVIFYLKAPKARGVAFVSSLNAYSPHMARKTGSSWVVTVAADSEFSYFYIVDGDILVPECTFYEKDDFGSRNCVYIPE